MHASPATAAPTRAAIFEDDYDSEYRYAGRPMPALQGLDRQGLVLFAGSFSKVLVPSLRLGYLVMPPHLVDRISAVQSISNRHAPAIAQAALCDFITDGRFGRHLRRMREIYVGRSHVLMESAREQLAGALEISGIEAGLQTAGWLRNGIESEWAVRAAATRGVEVASLSQYYRGRGGRPGLHPGFAAVDISEIHRGVRELAIALDREWGRPE